MIIAIIVALALDSCQNGIVWVFITGGCSGRGVQWMGVRLYNKTSV